MINRPQIVPLYKKLQPHLLSTLKKLAIHEKSRIIMIDYKDILYCKAESNYTIIYLNNNEKIVASKCLKNIIERINSNRFMRVHSSYFVNLSKVESIVKKDNWMIEIGRYFIPISRSNKEEVLAIFSY